VTNKTNKPSQSKAEQKEETRARVLQAVLDIIVSDGMRAVRHRAVAEKAKVALGTTTYHFSSIEDLIISAFSYWRLRIQLIENPYYQKMSSALEAFEGRTVSNDELPNMAAHVYELSVGYIVDQLSGKRDDRLIELAFYHESMLYPSLRELMMQTWDTELAYLELIHATMGSPLPADDARITFTLFRQLEQAAVMKGLQEIDIREIRQTLHRHMSLCFQTEFDR